MTALLVASCQESCGDHLDCAADEFCESGSCKGMGDRFRKPCATVDDCGEGYCISGYCYGIGESCTCHPLDPCTETATACVAACQTELDCADGNACTEDACVNGSCDNLPSDTAGCCAVDGDCDDANPCTKNSCIEFQCSYAIDPAAGCCQTALDCDDANPCTEDSCDDDGACVNTSTVAGCCVVDEDCEDGDPCTEEFCAANQCMNPRSVDSAQCTCAADEDCADGNPCSVEHCSDEGRCAYAHDPEGLLPGSQCCGSAAQCNDSDANTTDGCEHNICRNEIKVICESESDCYELDPCALYTCSGGYCVVEQEIASCCKSDLQCDDDDECTEDACVDNNCQHGYVALAGCCESDTHCNDSEVCTKDFCCLDASCDSPLGLVPMFHCVHEAAGVNCCVTDEECKDDNWCTSDLCEANNCVHQNKETCCYFKEDCDDGVWCTADDCVEGDCQNIAAPGCCLSEADCDDADPCTNDYCLEAVCSYVQKEACCGSDADCPSGNPCIIGTCVAEACVYEEAVGCCQAGDSCDDGDPCTFDQCLTSQCVHTPDADPFCCEPTVVAASYFDGAVVEGTTWTLQSSSTQVGWSVADSGPAFSGSGALRYHASAGGYNTPGVPNSGSASSTPITIPWESDILIGFMLYADVRPAPGVDQLSLYAHDMDEGEWIKVWEKGMLDEGVGASWQPVWISSDLFAGKTVLLKFEFDTVDAATTTGKGVFIDDVIVGHGCVFGSVACLVAEDCEDDDPCTDAQCVEGTCGIVNSSAPGCCGPPVLSTTFDALPPNGNAESNHATVGWNLSAARAYSPPTSLYFGDPATQVYDGGDQQVLGTYTLAGLNLSGFTAPQLAFKTWLTVEPYPFVDHVQVLVTPSSGGAETEVWNKKTPGVALDGSAGWIPVVVDLSSWAGQTISLSFRFDTIDGSSNAYEGVYIDDLVLGDTCAN